MRLFLLSSLLLACGARSEIAGVVEDAEVPDVHDAAVADHHDAGVVDAIVVDAGCSAILVVGTVTPTPSSCWIDQKVGNRSAALTWDCQTGAAEADFAVPFTGTVDPSGDVSLEATTTFPWSDGCTWQSTQTITGLLSSHQLTYSYSEQPISGTSCAPGYCKATTPVAVE